MPRDLSECATNGLDDLSLDVEDYSDGSYTNESFCFNMRVMNISPSTLESNFC